MEDKIFNYFYEELIMSIITLSLPAERQIEIIGIGCVGDEMVIDFDSYYTCHKDEYILRNTFTDNQLNMLNDFDGYLEELNRKVSDDDFYYDKQQLYDHPLWEEVRIRAKKLLSVLDMDNYDIEISRIVTHETDEEGKSFTIENTKRRIVNK